MKIIVTYLLLLWSLGSYAQVLQKVENFGSNPGNISMFFYAPKSTRSEKLPLVIALHGCTQTAQSMAEQSGWMKLADEQGILILLPQQHVPNNPQHCFNWFRSADIEKDRGEVGSIKQMIDHSIKYLHADPGRIYVYGLSAGAAMAVALMADYPDIIKGGAIFAGTPYKMATNVFEGSRAMMKPYDKSCKEWAKLVIEQNPNFKGPYPEIQIWQGTNDKIVNPKSSTELSEQWLELYKADLVADKAEVNYSGNPDITKYTYFDQSGHQKMMYYKVNNMGHAVLVDPGTTKTQGGKTGPFAVDKDFHSTYEVAKNFGLIHDN